MINQLISHSLVITPYSILFKTKVIEDLLFWYIINMYIKLKRIQNYAILTIRSMLESIMMAKPTSLSIASS